MGNRAKKRKQRQVTTNEPSEFELEQEFYKESLVDPSSREYVYDEVDNYEDLRDEEILKLGEKLLPQRDSSKEQVLGLDLDYSDEEEEDEDEVDEEEEEQEDVSGEEEEESGEDMGEEESDSDKEVWEMDDDDGDISGMPMMKGDDRAWGKEKSAYIGTDTSDQAIHFKLFRQQDELAKLEEATARQLQNRMAAELKDLESEDLIPEIQIPKEEKQMTETAKTKEDRVEVDISKLSRTKKLQLLKRESPEFLPLVEDLKNKCEEIQVFLRPLMQAIKDGYIEAGPQKDYITTKYRILLNYVSVLSIYMMTKCNKVSVGKHPVVGRLAQYRQLLQELEICDEKYGPKLHELLESIEKGVAEKKKVEVVSKKKMKKLQLLEKKKQQDETKEEKMSRRVTFAAAAEESEEPAGMGSGKGKKRKRKQKDQKEAQQFGKNMEADEKRGLNYEISKNRGLVPYRKKEDVNPRVNYKRKFKKKVTKHKSQVAPMRKEIKRYDGELTGIKSHTIKSVKIK